MSSLSGHDEKKRVIQEKINSDLKTLPSVFSSYCDYLRSNGKTDTTIQSYLNALLVCVRTIRKEYYISDNGFYRQLTAANIQKHFEEKIDLTIDTQQSHWSALNSFFKFLVEEDYISKNPMVIIPRPSKRDQSKRKMNYLSREQLDSLLSNIKCSPTKFTAFRDEVIIKLAISTGLDVTDLVNLNFDNIDYIEGNIKVVNTKGEHTIPIGNTMLTLLKSWSNFRSQYFEGSDTPALFVSTLKYRMSVDAASKMLAKYCEQSNVPHMTFKDLKSTMVYLLAKENVSMEAIMELLNTSDYMNVVQAYDAAIKERKVEIHDALNQLFAQPLASRNTPPKPRRFGLEVKLPEYSTYRGGEKGFTLYVNVSNHQETPIQLRLKSCAIYMNGMLRNSDYSYTGYQFNEEIIFPKTVKTFGKIWITDSFVEKELKNGDYLVICLFDSTVNIEYHIKYMYNESLVGNYWSEENRYEIGINHEGNEKYVISSPT